MLLLQLLLLVLLLLFFLGGKHLGLPQPGECLWLRWVGGDRAHRWHLRWRRVAGHELGPTIVELGATIVELGPTIVELGGAMVELGGAGGAHRGR